MGNPPAKGFAKHITSGVTFQFWQPNNFPVRPKLVCTSSNIRSTFFSLQISRTCCKYPSGGTRTPPSPRIGSIKTAAVFSVMASRIFSALSGATCLTSGIRGINGSRYFLSHVADNAPMVLPWNAPIRAIISGLPVCLRASFMAHSTDSAPLFERNALSNPFGVILTSFSINSARLSL